MVVYHYNESLSAWEYIGTYTTSADRHVTATFASLSPVGLVNLSANYSENSGDGSENPSGSYLTFSSNDEFDLSANSVGWDGTMEYSTDRSTWSTWTGSSIRATEDSGRYYVYLRGTNNSVVTAGYGKRFVISGSEVSCSGNIESLLDYETVEAGEHPSMGNNCFQCMFQRFRLCMPQR